MKPCRISGVTVMLMTGRMHGVSSLRVLTTEQDTRIVGRVGWDGA